MTLKRFLVMLDLSCSLMSNVSNGLPIGSLIFSSSTDTDQDLFLLLFGKNHNPLETPERYINYLYLSKIVHSIKCCLRS